MEVISVDGETRFVSPSPTKDDRARVCNIVVNRFSRRRNIFMQKVEQPIFCFSCQQAVVEFKDQACPACVQKIENLSATIPVRPFWVVISIVGIISAAILLVNLVR